MRLGNPELLCVSRRDVFREGEAVKIPAMVGDRAWPRGSSPGTGRGVWPEGGPPSQPHHGGRTAHAQHRSHGNAAPAPPAPPRSPALTHGAHRPAQRRAGPDRGHSSEPAAPGRAQDRGQRCGAASSGGVLATTAQPPALTPLAALHPALHTDPSHWPGAAGALGCCSLMPGKAGRSRHALAGRD